MRHLAWKDGDIGITEGDIRITKWDIRNESIKILKTWEPIETHFMNHNSVFNSLWPRG